MRHLYTLVLTASVFSMAAAASAVAADLLVLEPVAMEAAAPGVISYRFGVSAGGIHNTNGGNGLEAPVGVDYADTRYAIGLEGAVGYLLGDFGFQLGAQLNFYGEGHDGYLDDYSQYHGDVFGHVFYAPTESWLIGAFGGIGKHEDYGDSDEPMGYWFVGAEALAQTDWGHVFGQVGYLDSYDEYDEGTQQAPFVRAGLTYFIDDNFAITAAGSLAGGRKSGSGGFPNRTIGLEIEPEYKFADSPVSIFGRYEFNQISYVDGPTYGDNFHVFKVGLRIRSDGTLRDNLSGGGGVTTPMAGQWTAYNANEIE